MKRKGEKRCNSAVTYTLDAKEIEQAILDYIANKTKGPHGTIGDDPKILGGFTENRGYGGGGRYSRSQKLDTVTLEYTMIEMTEI